VVGDEALMLGAMAETYHQKPSSWLIPQAPLHLQYWFDRAIWRRSLLPAQPEGARKVVNGTQAERPIGTITGNVIQLFGGTVPWVGGEDEDD